VRVFLAATSLHPAYGGPAYSVSRTATALATAGVSVGLWAADGSAASTPLLPAESPVQRLSGSEAYALQEFGTPDILHDNGIWLLHNHRLSQLASARGVPRVVSTRGMLAPWAMNHKRSKKRVAWHLYQRRDLARAQVLHATSEAEAMHIRQLELGVPVTVIVNGVDIPGLDPVEGDLPIAESDGSVRTALFLGRLYPVKGLPLLIEAWARIRPAGWRLRIAGPDEAGHRAVVERAVSRASLDDMVSFAGPLEGPAKGAAYLNADLFVLPSYSESFGMSVAEALAHALPVLTTTAAPWPSLEDQNCGWCVEPTICGMTEGLRKATSQTAEVLRAMGVKGRKMVSLEYGWGSAARQLVGLYEDVV